MIEPRSLGANVLAGLVTALVAIPLNVALAIACGLPPSAGLASGAVAGVVGALFGGARLQVTGPEVALAPLSFAIVAAHGLSGLAVATLLAGVLQLAFALLRVGKLVHLVREPVVAGFLTAVGLLVLDAQLPRLAGAEEGIRGLASLATSARGHVPTLLVGAVCIAVAVLAPRIHPRIPGPLVALVVGIVAVAVGVPGVATVEPVAAAFPLPRLPQLAQVDILRLLPSAVALAALASLDSLLCAASIDQRLGGPRFRSDQELAAQGVANILSSFFGGMPVAAAIVRSAAAVDAGATTRLAPLVQSIALALVLVALGPFLGAVPLVALAAVLIVVGAKLIALRSWLDAWRRSDRLAATATVVTTLGILFVDFIVGVAAGAIFLAVGRRLSRSTNRTDPTTALPADVRRGDTAR
jgi:SulP family sulfate permease